MTVDENYQFNMDGKDELKRHEDKGEMDLAFEYPGVDGDNCLDWYRDRIIKLSNEKIQCKN